MTKEAILEKITDVVKIPMNDYVADYVKSGGKVMGYYCTYIPEEIFTAAGLLPYRIHGTAGVDTGEADAYLSARLCTFVRTSVAMGLDGTYDFLEGIVLTQACDHIRRGADVWRNKIKRPFYSFLSIPRTPREWVFDWYLEELKRLKAELEGHLGVVITDEKLADAIKIHNDIRERLNTISDMRTRQKPPVTGEEALSITIASMVMPKGEFIELMDKLIPILDDSEIDGKYRARFILTGGEFDEPDYIRTIEEQGGLVVGEDLCYGSRTFRDTIDEKSGGDPMEAIARRYFFKVSCARMVGGFTDRLESIKDMLKEKNADGILFQRIKFCDPWASDAHNLKYSLKDADIPTLFLEREYGVLAKGQVQTRVQGFLESIGK